MINANMRLYDYYTFSGADKYGQQKMSETAQGKIKMSIAVASQSVQDSVLYSGAQYIGLTQNPEINDSWVIQYGEEKLKVLYVNAHSRFKAVFLAKVG